MKFVTSNFVHLDSNFNWESIIKSFGFYSVSEKIKPLLSHKPNISFSSFWSEIYAASEDDIGSKFVFDKSFHFNSNLAELSHLLYSRKFLFQKFLGTTGTVIAPGTVIEEKYYPMLLFLYGSISLALKDMESSLIDGDNVMYIKTM